MVVQAKTIRQVQQPFETRRSKIEVHRTAQAKIYQVFGRVEFQGSGETTFDVKFPVWFVDPPQITFGAELGANQILEAGTFPRVNLMVRRWDVNIRGGHTYYLGAQFIMVVDGPAEMVAIAHWQCEGTALTNPLTGDISSTLESRI
jgi:hypothetical protein